MLVRDGRSWPAGQAKHGEDFAGCITVAREMTANGAFRLLDVKRRLGQRQITNVKFLS